MKGLADETLYKIIHDYFLLYLPRMRKCSDNTIRSYREAISSLLEFIAKRENISLSAITFKMITSDMLSAFLDSLEKQGVCINTRNQRLQAIRSFFGYAVMVDPALMIYRNEIYKVPVKKDTNKTTIEYLSEKAVKVLLEQPDRTTEKGMRDIFILLLMYDSAARVQELVDIKICDLINGKTPVVILHGKGAKVRTVPLMESTMLYFEKYFSIYHSEETPHSNQYLFYNVRHGKKNPLDTSTIRKMISKYGKAARELCPAIPENVHPHLLRHSRAMHLYQHGMELSLISQWLGHSQYETTLIYAHADTEQKRKAIEQATSKNNVLKKSDASKRYVISDDGKSSTMSTLSFYHISEKISPKVVQLESRDSRNSYNTNTEVFLMNTRQKLHQIHLNEWATRFADQKASGLTVRQWCDQNNYSVHTYNYWKHILKEELANQVLPDIVPITIPEPVPQMLPTAGPLHSTLANSAIRATAKLSVNGISIEFDSTASEEFLRTIIKAACYA